MADADDVLKDIEKWGAISTAVPSVVAILVLFIVIAIAVQLQRIKRNTTDLTNHFAKLQIELQNLSMVISNRGDDLSASSFQRLEATVLTLPQTILAQLSTHSRKEYNEEILSRSGGLLPTKVVGPPVPPKRANSYFKPTYY